MMKAIVALPTERGLVLDAIFVGLTILFFVIAIGYVAVCEWLMD